MALKIGGRPDLGKENSGKHCRIASGRPGQGLQAEGGDIVAENLGKGEFWLVQGIMSAAGETLTYSGIIIKKTVTGTSFKVT